MSRPSVFILGAQKAGTTTLSEMLARHPEVFVPSIKETYFYCDESRWAQGLEWYAQEFYAPSAVGGARLLADATPFYLASDAALTRIAGTTGPEARFVALLRDPVKRAFSAWQHQKRLGNEDLDFEAALEAEPARVAEARAAGGRWWRHAYAEVGNYAPQLERAFDLLGRERVLVLDSRDLADQAALGARLGAHLGLTAPFGTEEIKANRASQPRSRLLGRLITGQNPVKRLAKALVPRELRTRIGMKLRDANLKEGGESLSPEAAARLATRLAPQIEALAKMQVVETGHWGAGQ